MPAPPDPPAGPSVSEPLPTGDWPAARDTDRRTDTALGTTVTPGLQPTGAFVPAANGADDSSATGGYTPADGPAESAAVGVPGYQILGLLGRGGMGVVYKARQVALDRVVALKMILAGPHASASVLARFHTEARAVAALQHPNIVQIHEVGEAGGLPFFSLEFVPGGPLSKKVAHEPQPPRYAAETVAALARAMHYAHAAGVVHRDLKPANVLLAADGTPKVTDFGLAKRLERDSGQTQEGAVLGTPSYMAPEQARGEHEQVGPAADIYALGAILYDLLTGRPPFSGSSVLDTLEMVRTREPVPPSQLAGRLPRDLETICLKCLQKDPARRYPTAGALTDDLGRFLDGRPILARPVSAPERAWRWAKRNPLGAAVIGLVFLTAAVGSVLSWQLYLAKGEADRNAQAADASAQVANAEKEQAQKERDLKEAARAAEAEARRAEAEFQQAITNVLRGVLLPIDDAIRNNARLLPIRRKALETAVRDAGFVRGLLDKRPAPLLGRTEAIAYTRLADVMLRAGKVKESRDLSLSALAILERMADQDPTDPVAKRNLAGIQNQVADVEVRLGQTASARRRYDTALRLRREWEAMVPGHPAADHAAAQSLGLLGAIDFRLGDPAGAMAHLQAADKEYAGLPADYVKRTAFDVRRERAVVKEFRGRAQALLGDPAAAEADLRASIRDRDALARDYARDPVAAPTVTRDRTLSRLVLGDLFLTRGDLRPAWTEYARAFAAFDERYRAEPDNLDARRDLAAAHYRLGVLAPRMAAGLGPAGDLLAGWHFAHCLRLRQGLAAADPADTQGQMELLLALARCGRAAEAEAVAGRLRAAAGDDRRVLFQVACGLAVAGTGAGPAADRCREQTWAVLDRVIELGWKDRVGLETEPDLEAARRDPRFKERLDRLPKLVAERGDR